MRFIAIFFSFFSSAGPLLRKLNNDKHRHNKKSVESLLARHAHFEAFAMPYPKHNKQLEVHAVYANCLYGLDTVIIHITRTFIVTLCGLEM